MYVESLASATEDYKEFDNLVRLASEICGTRSALINFLDDDHQLTCFNTGWENTKVPRGDSICQLTVGTEGLLQIPDTNNDSRLREIKAVRENPEIRFYAGVSFKGIDGYPAGTLCVIDDKPRKLSKMQQRVLKTLAADVESRLELILSRQQIIKQNSKMEKTVRFLNNSADIMLLMEPGTLLINQVHSDVYEKLGYTVDELEGAIFTDYCTNPEVAEKLRRWSESWQLGKFSFEIRFKKRSDEPLPMLIQVSRSANNIYLTGRDISKRKAAERRLTNALQRLKHVQHIARLGSWEWDVVNDELFWSDETYEILQIDKDKHAPSLKLMLNIIHPDDRSKFTGIIDAVLNGKQINDWQHDLLLPDGSIKHLYGRAEVLYDSEGNPVKATGTIQDITEQKRAERRLEHTLVEKKTMLAEIHHRVKNNLAIVSGLLEMEFENAKDSQTYNTLRKSVSRIKSMAMIHEMLYTSEDFSNISFGEYINDLVRSIHKLHQEKGKRIEVVTDTEEVSLNINQAIPCALILNELLTNSFKHAFPDRQRGLIKVDLNKDREDILMRVRDDGKGIDEPYKSQERSGSRLGFTLLEVLAKQLHADYKVYNNEGTVVDMRFAHKPEKQGPGGNMIMHKVQE